MKTINIITQTFLEILAIYFRELWTCPNMADHTQQKSHDQTISSMNVSLLPKNQYNNSIGGMLFPNTMGIPRHSWPHPTKNYTIKL